MKHKSVDVLQLNFCSSMSLFSDQSLRGSNKVLLLPIIISL